MLSAFCVTKAINANRVEFFWFEDESADKANNCSQKLYFENNSLKHLSSKAGQEAIV
jgi:hypothetical protein